MNTSTAYCDYYDVDCQDPAFYTWNSPEWVATRYVGNRMLEVWTVGDMRVSMPNGDVLRYADDLRWAGIKTDRDLENIDPNSWENNS